MIAAMPISRTVWIGCGEFSVDSLNLRTSSDVGIFGNLKALSPNSFPVLVDARLPLSALRHEVDADKTGFIVSLHGFIAGVGRMVGFAQHLNSVIGSVTKFVINAIGQPLAVNDQPRKDVSGVVHPFTDLDFDIAGAADAASGLSSVTGIPFSGQIGAVPPFEQARHGVIIENGFDEIRRQRGVSFLWHSFFHQWGKVSLSRLPIFHNTSNLQK